MARFDEPADLVGEALDAATRQLAATGSSSPRLDATLLLESVTGIGRPSLFAHPERALTAEQERQLRALVARRAASEPIAYILGAREFYGRPFKADARALIPRPETEMLVDLGLDFLKHARVGSVSVDVGTGSGAIAVTLAAETGRAVAALDVSPAALSLARENARALGQETHVHLVRGNLLSPLRGPLDLVLANLPYIPDDRVVPRDVGSYEPALALFGGPCGTTLIRALLAEAVALLAPGALLACEIDDDQAASLTSYAQTLFPAARVDVLEDGAGLHRVLRVRLTG